MKDFRPQAWLVFALAMAAGCSKPALPDEQPSPAPILAVAKPKPKPKPSAAAPPNLAASAVVAIRQRSASLGAPPERPRHLAFGRGFLLQVTESEIVTRASSSGELLVRTPLQASTALTLPAGSVLVASQSAAYRFDPGETRGHPLPRIWLMPDSLLLPDLTTQEKVWVVNPGTRYGQRYAFGSEAALAIEAERAFADYDGGAIAVLSDGDFLYSAGRVLVRDLGFGKPKRFALPSEIRSVWRLAAAERIDRTWLVDPSGTIFLFELGERPRIVRRFETSRTPIDFAASKGALGLLSVSERSGEPRRFELSVYAPDGALRFAVNLDSVEVTADPNWAADALRDRELVLGGEPLRVAVGGARTIRLLDGRSGEMIEIR